MKRRSNGSSDSEIKLKPPDLTLGQPIVVGPDPLPPQPAHRPNYSLRAAERMAELADELHWRYQITVNRSQLTENHLDATPTPAIKLWVRLSTIPEEPYVLQIQSLRPWRILVPAASATFDGVLRLVGAFMAGLRASGKSY